jgi:hypothetical protein
VGASGDGGLHEGVAGLVGEERGLAAGAEARQIGDSEGALLVSVGDSGANAELGEYRAQLGERLDEDACGELLVVRDVAIAAAAVGDAVEGSDLVREGAAGEIAEDLNAQVPVGGELTGQAALGEERGGFGL